MRHYPISILVLLSFGALPEHPQLSAQSMKQYATQEQARKQEIVRQKALVSWSGYHDWYLKKFTDSLTSFNRKWLERNGY